MKIIAARSDGGVSVFEFAPRSVEGQAVLDAPDQLEVIVAGEIAAWEQSAGGAKITSWRVGEPPEDRTFRDAWIDLGNVVTTDMIMARDIWRAKLRHKRDRLLAKLDIEQLRGRDVEVQKQALRDVTADPGIEAAQTPEDLKKVWPVALG